ncbi:hypothetical protein EDF55_0095 [Curtobacterium sp. ZW137]|nr:hypothetical protein EDF55_0095 [Curtobacterium sp. ZW137]
MRARGFRWSQATVWSIEKGERPLRLSEAQAAAEVLNQPFFNFTADEGEAKIEAWMRECSQAAQEIDAAIDRFEQARFNLALTEEFLPERPTNRHYNAGGWLSTTVEDIVRQHRQRDRGDEENIGQVSGGSNGAWIEQYNATIAKEYPNGKPEAED